MKINQMYQSEKIKEEMREHFEENGFLQLHSFLSNSLEEFQKELVNKINSHKYQPNSHSYYENEKSTQDTNTLLFIEDFKSTTFTSFLEEVTGFSLTPHKSALRKYSHKNYSLLNDENVEEEDFLEVIFDLSDEFDEDAGGYLAYTTQREEILYLEPSFNTLTFLFKPKELMSYLKYINNKGKNKNIVRLELTFKIIE